MTIPALNGPLVANPDPLHVYSEAAGDVYVTGILSGLGVLQRHAQTGALFDADNKLADISNGMVMVQKPSGLLQFYVQAGTYTQSALGIGYVRATDATDLFYGPLPVAFVKVAPSEKFSLMAGKLLTLIGTENTFTFQNANIQRGLLWNQTNAVNRGVQANYADGNVSAALSVNDGFYSGQYSWVSSAFTYAFDTENSLTLLASGNLDRSRKNTLATPLAQNNSQLTQLMYSYTVGNWNLAPTLQYTRVPKDVRIGIADSASTYGVGLTTKYKWDAYWSLASRAEYIDSRGSAAAPNLIYGAKSSAWSLTLTPTFQYKVFFARAEASYVRAQDISAGSAMGRRGNSTSQARLMLETGILF